MGLQEKIIQLESALKLREGQTEELIDDYEKRLAEAMAAQDINASRRTPQSHRSVRECLSLTWSFAQWRMVLLLVLIAIHIGTAERVPVWASLLCAATVLWFFLLWCAAEIDQSGWGRLLIKLGIVGAGCIAAYAHPDSALVILIGLILLAATRLINNVADRLMEVPVIASVIGWFL